MKQDNKKITIILLFIAIIPIVWLALLLAPHIDGGIIQIIKEVPTAMNNPFNIEICENSTRTVFLFLLIYTIAVGVYYSTKGNYRRKEEYGSAKWGFAKKINKKYKQLPQGNNKILTQNVSIGLNGRKHRRNLNVLVCGRKWGRKNAFFWKTKCNAM